MTNSFETIADFENMMSLTGDVKSVTQTRWERKRLQQQQLSNQSTNSAVDRYIPNRSGMDFDLSQHSYCEENSCLNESQSDASDYAKLLSVNASSDQGINADNLNKSSSRILAFKNKAPAPKDGYQNSLKVLYSQYGGKKASDVVKPSRHIASAPVRILDAPDMLDDYCKYFFHHPTFNKT